MLFRSWLKPFEGEDYGWDAFFSRIDAVVMGATTYRDLRAMGDWPYRGKAAIVMTSRPRIDDDGLAVFDDRSPVEIAVELERAGLRRIWIVGGGGPIRAFLDAGLMRRLHLFQIPVILGAGTPLWRSGGKPWPVSLRRVVGWRNGVVETEYEVG